MPPLQALVALHGLWVLVLVPCALWGGAETAGLASASHWAHADGGRIGTCPRSRPRLPRRDRGVTVPDAGHVPSAAGERSGQDRHTSSGVACESCSSSSSCRRRRLSVRGDRGDGAPAGRAGAPADGLAPGRAGVRGGRPGAAGAGADQPAGQRGQVHRTGRGHPADRAGGSRASRPAGAGTTAGGSSPNC